MLLVVTVVSTHWFVNVHRWRIADIYGWRIGWLGGKPRVGCDHVRLAGWTGVDVGGMIASATWALPRCPWWMLRQRRSRPSAGLAEAEELAAGAASGTDPHVCDVGCHDDTDAGAFACACGARHGAPAAPAYVDIDQGIHHPSPSRQDSGGQARFDSGGRRDATAVADGSVGAFTYGWRRKCRKRLP